MNEATIYECYVAGVNKGHVKLILLEPPTKASIIDALDAEAEFNIGIVNAADPDAINVEFYEGRAKLCYDLMEVVKYLPVSGEPVFGHRVEVAGVYRGCVNVESVRAWSSK